MKIEITEKEMVLLIKESINGKIVDYTFGVGWVAIDDQNPINKWAVDRINEIRNPYCI